MNSQAGRLGVGSKMSEASPKRKYKRRGRKFSSRRRVSQRCTKAEEMSHGWKLDEEGYMVDDIPTYDSTDEETSLNLHVENIPNDAELFASSGTEGQNSQTLENFQAAGPGDGSKKAAPDMKKKKKISIRKVGTRFSQRLAAQVARKLNPKVEVQMS